MAERIRYSNLPWLGAKEAGCTKPEKTTNLYDLSICVETCCGTLITEGCQCGTISRFCICFLWNTDEIVLCEALLIVDWEC